MTPGGHFFINFGVFFIDFWSLEVTFFDILASRSRLSTCLVPWGVQGCRTQVPVTCSYSPRGSILEHFFDKNHVIFGVLFCMCVWMSFFMIFDDFWTVFKRFLDNFFHYFVKS